jgi:hypothetical protein
MLSGGVADEAAQPGWDAKEAEEATKLLRKKMFMSITNAAGEQSAERQFMQVPDKDVDAFLKFVAQGM